MNACRRGILALAAAAALLTMGAADATARMRPSLYDVVIDLGAVQPQGDLEAGFDTPAGFEAGTGYEVGLRYRQRFTNGWAVSPSFHYVQFGKYLGSNETAGDFETGTSMYRYGVDVQYFFPARRHAPRLFLSGGAALTRNRLREDYLDSGDYFQDKVDAVALAGGLGLQVGSFEFLAQYHRNHFDTKRFYAADSYDWDYISLTVGIALPTHY
ncbi:MAG TPA: outer membrane beta-barrel protein [Candidatus Krumholzibacteria bacterium]|nr:outer membrane beta-barrel protein [Candidatus Krumholzibacteria bacterium]HRX51778.1 outer membrane beta-barrel protein [Candidatus Krumholzibacteria bacterium]